jgi:hypothetical protein
MGLHYGTVNNYSSLITNFYGFYMKVYTSGSQTGCCDTQECPGYVSGVSQIFIDRFAAK